MRPIAHARRLSSRAASSRHALDAVVVANPVPVGIPAYFLADQLLRRRTAEEVLSGKRGLIAEYAGAEGYAFIKAPSFLRVPMPLGRKCRCHGMAHCAAVQ